MMDMTPAVKTHMSSVDLDLGLWLNSLFSCYFPTYTLNTLAMQFPGVSGSFVFP